MKITLNHCLGLSKQEITKYQTSESFATNCIEYQSEAADTWLPGYTVPGYLKICWCQEEIEQFINQYNLINPRHLNEKCRSLFIEHLFTYIHYMYYCIIRDSRHPSGCPSPRSSCFTSFLFCFP